MDHQTLERRLLDLQEAFHTLADEAPDVGLSWDETEDPPNLPPPRFALVHNVGRGTDHAASRDVFGERFIRLAIRGGTLLSSFKVDELSPEDTDAGRVVLNCSNPAEGWYRLLTIRQRHRFLQVPAVDGYEFPDRQAENLAYASELMIDQLLTAVVCRGDPDEDDPPDELLAELTKQQRRMIELVWDKPVVARHKFEAHVWKGKRVPLKKSVERDVQRLDDRLIELSKPHSITIDDEFVKFERRSAK